MVRRIRLSFIVFPLMAACCLGACGENPSDVYDEGPAIREPLVKAAADNNVTEIRKLLASGHNINAKSRSGFTALSIAVRYERTDAVRELLINGADILVRDRYGRLPLEIVMQKAEAGHYLEIAKLLVKHGADPDYQSPDSLQSPREYARNVNAQDLLQAIEEGEKERLDPW